ncbi:MULTISPECIES: universal stress protein UspF [Buttiauxella]|uniref:Universal stress protein F n=1 Tax=Buttiauxella agrestis ATCC 33320 TaxID=1006004 RepID=A0A085G069_9ENTR|nr:MULTISPECIES: universal stress protein UspF [Buttiauxella]KFC77114.1 universal stress protein F [Buttiauxella agrestis ATCC 33320]MCS3603680.1 universal stress protein F [Buttiauxella sp. BIGb0471]BCG07586.1 universal stress protein UspF [Buttiauxella agrestis]
MSKKILVPIDISEMELTKQVIPHVENYAKLDDATIHFLAVIPDYTYFASYGLGYASIAPDAREREAAALETLSDIIAKFKIPDDRIEKHVLSGTPKDHILGLAEDIDADVIILASHRPSMSTYLLGSNAAAVVRHARCSVLVVR